MYRTLDALPQLYVHQFELASLDRDLAAFTQKAQELGFNDRGFRRNWVYLRDLVRLRLSLQVQWYLEQSRVIPHMQACEALRAALTHGTWDGGPADTAARGSVQKVYAPCRHIRTQYAALPHQDPIHCTLMPNAPRWVLTARPTMTTSPLPMYTLNDMAPGNSSFVRSWSFLLWPN